MIHISGRRSLVRISAAVWCLAFASSAHSQDALRFEAEDWTTPKDAWRVNGSSKDKWNLWSKDSDADKKWSGGVVLQSPLVLEEREKPEDGAPALHTHITGIPNGTYVVELTTVGRGLAISFDGKTWVRKTDRSLGAVKVTDGTFDLWVDDRHAHPNPKSRGSTYYDAIVFSPVRKAEDGLINGGFESTADAKPSGWTYWSRERRGSVSSDQTVKRTGQRSALIQHDGERDWALTNAAMLAVEPKQIFTVSAWVKSEASRADLAVVAYAGGKLLRWSIASAIVPEQCDWTRIYQSLRVPSGCEQLQVRFSGRGDTKLWVDDVAIKPGMEPRAQKPKVAGFAQRRVVETLDRGMVAMPTQKGQVYVGWRLLASDPRDVTFSLYRRVGEGNPERLNAEPIRETTDFIDTTAPPNVTYSYFVKPIVNGREGAASSAAEATLSDAPQPYISIKLDGGHTFQKAGIADLDGDGRYDVVIKQPRENIDPAGSYWYKSPVTYKLEAYTAGGKLLWRHDLGWAIERGIWYSPYIVFDLDGDGKAEVAAKTGEGDPRDEDGRVRSGPEYVSILDGMTGEVVCRTEWPSREGIRNYNLQSRNQICVAYLDGKTPCLIVARGTYGTIKLVAYEYRDRRLREMWRWDNRNEPGWYRAQGAHIMHGADVDGDGRDEVVIGSAVVDDNGVGLWATGLGHPDYCFVGDIDPSRPGLEIFYGIEPRQKENALCLVDAKTGGIIWGLKEPTTHVGSDGMCADIDVRYPGLECHVNDIDRERKFAHSWIFSAAGELLSREESGSMSRAIFWDADCQKELIRGSRIIDYGGGEHEPRIDGGVVAFADLLGDWREEIVVSRQGELRIYTTTIPAVDRRVCLMQDPIYRLSAAVQTMGYWGAPMLSYCPVSRHPTLAIRLDASKLLPQKATTGQMILVAPAEHAWKGTLAVTSDDSVAVSPPQCSVDLQAGETSTVSIQVALRHAPDPLAGGASARIVVTVTPAAKGGDTWQRTVQTQVAVSVADLPLEGVPMAQAESFAAQGGGKVQLREDKLGSVGKAISHWDDEGHWIEWKLAAPRAGKYRLALRYCAPHEAVRELLIDGRAAESASRVRFPSSGGFGGPTVDHWAHWVCRDGKAGIAAIELAPGLHTIRLTNVDGKGLNLDYLAFVPVEQ